MIYVTGDTHGDIDKAKLEPSRWPQGQLLTHTGRSGGRGTRTERGTGYCSTVQHITNAERGTGYCSTVQHIT